MQRKKNAISREPVQPVGIVSRVHQLIELIVVFIHILWLHGAPVGLACA
jgi:hypothetical protein